MEEDNISGNGSATFCGFTANSKVTCTAQARSSVGSGAIATGLVYISNTQGSGKFCLSLHYTAQTKNSDVFDIITTDMPI